MTGAFVRIKRDGSWQNLEVEYLTDEERMEMLGQRSPAELVRWINVCSKQLVEVENFIKDAVERGQKRKPKEEP